MAALNGKVMVTGGAGYIGSHTCVELLQAGHDVTVFDNFSNSHPESLERVQQITGKRLSLIRGDIRDRAMLVKALRDSGARGLSPWSTIKRLRAASLPTSVAGRVNAEAAPAGGASTR